MTCRAPRRNATCMRMRTLVREQCIVGPVWDHNRTNRRRTNYGAPDDENYEHLSSDDGRQTVASDLV